MLPKRVFLLLACDHFGLLWAHELPDSPRGRTIPAGLPFAMSAAPLAAMGRSAGSPRAAACSAAAGGLAPGARGRPAGGPKAHRLPNHLVGERGLLAVHLRHPETPRRARPAVDGAEPEAHPGIGHRQLLSRFCIEP